MEDKAKRVEREIKRLKGLAKTLEKSINNQLREFEDSAKAQVLIIPVGKGISNYPLNNRIEIRISLIHESIINGAYAH